MLAVDCDDDDDNDDDNDDDASLRDALSIRRLAQVKLDNFGLAKCSEPGGKGIPRHCHVECISVVVCQAPPPSFLSSSSLLLPIDGIL